MTLTPAQWASGAIGRTTDPDGVAKYQCVDVPKDFFESVTGKSWREGWPGAGDARDMLNTANRDWFQVIPNDPSRPDQLPRRFDIVVYAGTAPGGLNEYGHIGVVWTADRDGVVLIDQDGFQQRAMEYDRLAWDNPGTGPVLGWLRLKLPTQTATIKKDWFDMATAKDLDAAVEKGLAKYLGAINTANGKVSIRQFVADGTRAAQAARDNTGTINRGGKDVPLRQEVADAKTLGLENKAAIADIGRKLDAVLAKLGGPANG